MIRVIYSYLKSALVFSVMLCAVIAGIVLVSLYTPDTFNLVVRIVGLVLLLVVTYTAVYAYTFKLIYTEIHTLGYTDCNCEKLAERMYKLSRRATFGSAKGALLIEYANALVYMGKYKNALIAASDAIVAAKDGIKGEAAICFCEIYFMESDAEYFNKYYAKATETLNKLLNSKSSADRAVASARLTAIQAMNYVLCGNRDSALNLLNGFNAPDTPILIKRNLEELRKIIQPF